MNIHVDVSVRVAILISDNCKPGEIKLPEELSNAYHNAVAKSPDKPISVSIMRYGAIISSDNVKVFKPTVVLSSDEKYGEINLKDAIPLGLDFGGDIVSVIFDESLSERNN